MARWHARHAVFKTIPNKNISWKSQKPRANRAIVPSIPFKNNL
jgi:hypothetical protein